MLQKLKNTNYVFILCLFGLTLITVSPVLAEDSAAFVECQQIKGDLKGKKNCFKNLARELQAAVEKEQAEKLTLLADNVRLNVENRQGADVDRAPKVEGECKDRLSGPFGEDSRNTFRDIWWNVKDGPCTCVFEQGKLRTCY